MTPVRRTPPRGGALAAILLLLVVLAGCATARPAATAGPRNIIILVADGTGAPQFELARQASVALRGRGLAVTDRVFRAGSVGVMTTHARDALTTDSAAAATAMSTGVKTRSGMIATTPSGDRLATTMQAAQLSGRRVGLVTTATVFDATPAAFSVHARSRRDVDTIIDGYLALAPDVLLGGGAAHFLPAAAGGRRRDARDVTAEFRAKGYAVARTRADLLAAGDGRLLGLFATEDLAHEMDRQVTAEPSLAEMTTAALASLTRAGGRGFVLLVENEATDTAGHANDVAALIQDVWAFDRALEVALAFQAGAPGETLILVTGDHETGGLSPTQLSGPAGRGVVTSSPEHLVMLSRIGMSLGRAAETLGRNPTDADLDGLLARHFPGFTLAPELRAMIQQRGAGAASTATTQSALARMITGQTGFAWATTAHSADPVVVGALGPGAERFRGWLDNTDFGRALHGLLASP